MPSIKKQVNVPKKASVVVPTTISSRIKPLGSGDVFLKVLLYGESRTGKTTIWGTFPAKILVLICSGGNKTGETRSLDTPENRTRIDVLTIDKSTDIKEAVDYAKSSGLYSTVVLDHVSGLQDLVLKEILGLEELPPQLSWGLASREQYGQCSLKCKTFLREILNLECNVVIVGQERTFKGKEDGISSDMIQPTIGVSVSPSLAGWLNPACDFILQTFIRPKMVTNTIKIGGKNMTTTVRGSGVDYCVRTEPHDIYYTKFRVPKGHRIPEVIVDPDYDKIVSVIKGE